MSSFLTPQYSLCSGADSVVEPLDCAPDGPEDTSTKVHLQELMQLTTVVSCQSQLDFSMVKPVRAESSESAAAWLVEEKRQDMESPRGISDWAAVFEEDKESPPGIADMNLSSGNSNDIVEGMRPGSCILPPSRASEIAHISVSENGLQKYCPATSVNPKATHVDAEYGYSMQQVARRGKCKKARMNALFRGLSPVQSMESNGLFLQAGSYPFPTTVEEVERSRSRERKIRNRASVQRCRAKKMYYYERLEAERKALRHENAAIEHVLSEIAATCDLLNIPDNPAAMSYGDDGFPADHAMD